MKKEINVNVSGGCLIQILLLSAIIFLFWGTPDNWDKLNDMIDSKHRDVTQSEDDDL